MPQFPPGTCSSLFCFWYLKDCSSVSGGYHAAYLARYPVVTFGSRGCHFAFLACISSSETLISSFSSGMLMLMISPSSTSAIGPPTAASGDTCPMDAPLDAPLKRPSVIRQPWNQVPYLRSQKSDSAFLSYQDRLLVLRNGSRQHRLL